MKSPSDESDWASETHGVAAFELPFRDLDLYRSQDAKSDFDRLA